VKTYRTHRFPPLDLVRAAAEAEHVHAPAAEAFQAAIERGQREGFESGQREGERAGYESGHASGHAAGLQAGQDEARSQAQGELERLAVPIDALRQQLQALNEDWQALLRRDVVELVERVARQVVRCELALKPAQILALVEETLAAMPVTGGAIEVYLNSGDLQRIAELDVRRPEAWALRADATLEPGECRVKVGDAEADAGCKRRLAACVDQIRSQLQAEAQE